MYFESFEFFCLNWWYPRLALPNTKIRTPERPQISLMPATCSKNDEARRLARCKAISPLILMSTVVGVG